MAESYDFSDLVVMIVDDNPHWVRVAKTVLNCMRITNVRTFPDAPSALTELNDWQPDVVFVDLAEHEFDGLKFIKVIRRREHRARTCPVVLVTAKADMAMVKRARNAGADYTLAKPFSLAVIHRTLSSLRNDKREFVQTATYFGPDRRRRDRPFEGEDRRKTNNVAMAS